MATISAMDPGLRYDDQDREMAQQRAAAKDYLMRQYMMNQQRQAQQQDQSAALAAQERMHGADLADRQAGRQDSYRQAMDITTLGQRPQLEALGFQKQMYGDTRADSEMERQLKNKKLGFQGRIMDDFMGTYSGGQQAGGQSSVFRPEDMRSMAFAMMGAEAPVDPAEKYKEAIRQMALKQAFENPRRAGDYAGVLESGDLSALPQTPEAAIPTSMSIPNLQQMAKSFAKQDNAFIGFDPEEKNVQEIIQARDQVAEGLIAEQRMDPAKAREQANFLVLQQLRADENSMGTEWIERLKQALQGVAAPQRAAPARFTPMSSPYGMSNPYGMISQ